MVHFRDLRLSRWDSAGHLWVAEAGDTSSVSAVPASRPPSGPRRATSDLLRWADASGPFIELCRQRVAKLVGHAE